MLQPRRTLLLYLTIVILATCDLFFRNVDCETEIDVDIFGSEDGSLLHEPSKVDRVKRDVGDVTTVLLVDNTGRHRDGRFHKKAVGLLTSTARTFVQEGTTTEFATEVLGTTLDNGRLYAQVVTTSSRVFYNGDSKIRDKTRTNLDELVLPSITLVADIARPTQPIQVLPSQVEESVIQVEPFSYAKSGNIYQTAVNGQQTPHSRFIGVPPRADDDIISVSAIDHKPSDRYEGSQVDSRDELEALFLQAKAKKHVNKYLHPAKEDERQETENLVKAKRMEYFKKKNTGDVEGQDTEINNLKPARVVKPLDDLPTFTVRHEFAPSGFSVDENEEDSTESRNLEINPRGNRSRSGKAFFGGNRIEQRKLDTVTYLGFSEFTTTVGDTVIIFMPHTTAAVGTHQGRKATSISGDATLAPELQHVTTENQVSVVTSVKTFMSHTPGMVTRTVTGHSLSMQTALPTMVVLPEIPSQTVTIRRDHKALQSVHVVDPITENPTDFEDAAQYLAHEQLEMAERIPTTPAQDLITEQFFDIDTIQPSSVSHNDNIEPSIEDIAEASSVVSSTEEIEVQSTDSLATFYTAQTQLFDTGGAEFPLGLIKVIGGTEAINGTTTLFTSLIYGTYVDGNYAQVIHSTSSVFFYIDHTKDDMRDAENTIQPTAVLGTSQNSATHITLSPPETTSSDAEETKETIPPTTPPLNVDSTDEPPQTTEGNLITTIEQSTTEDDNKRTTAVDETLSTAPTEETKTESDIDSINEVETGRKINLKAKEQEVIFEKDAKNIEKDSESQIAGSGERHLEDSRTPPSSTTDGPITQLIPTTVYKTFTYLTTFFIPAQGTSTTTSIRSREVTSSEISYITQTFNSDANKSTGKVDLKHNISTDSSSVVVSPTVSLATEENFDTTTDSIIAGTTNQNGDTMATPELPEEKTTLISEEMNVTTIPATTPRDLVQGEEDEIELIFKTLYTTYTYLTTFFQESTTSVSSREVVVTNVVTSTVDSSYILHASDPAVAGLFASDETLVTPSKHLSSIEPVPTSVGTGRPTTKYFPDLGVRPDEDLFSTVIESVDIEKELATPTPALNYDGGSGIIDNELKTFYTTYTYFTTILVDGETEISSRTEIYTNIVTPSGLLLSPTVSNIEPTISLREPLFEKDSNPDVLDQLESPQKHAPLSHFLESSQDSPHIETPVLKSTPHYSYSSTIFRSHKLTSDGNESSNINTVDVDDEENSIFQRKTPRFDSSYATISRSRDTVATPTALEEYASTKSPISSREIDSDKSLASVAVTKSVALDTPDVADKMSTVTSSSSDGRKVMMLEKRNDKQPLLDDQISSESNTEQLEPSPTLLLQTSYTTFTYFTTIYKGSSSSDVVSRLETVTNVVTETLSPSDAPTTRIAPEDATLPITYFTTFTYWTTLYKDGSTVVTSREETISNTVTPTVIPSPSASVFEISPTPASAETAVLSPTATLAEPTTFYTTYTYFTTSYIGNSTVLSSRLETVTNIVNDTANDVTGRAIGSGASEQNVSEQITKTESPVHSSLPLQPTGLLSTILTSEVNNGTTILFSTDVYGTFIDGLYAQVLESSTQIVTSPPVSSTKVNLELKPTGVVSLNEGRIVDADGVSTTYFTTRAIGTYIDTLYAEVVESTTTIKVNTERQSILAAISPSTTQGTKAQRTGLVRIVEGSIVKDETTTFYESRVVGTLIDGRYAQIIESTSSFKMAVTPTSVPGSSAGEIAATSTLSTDVTVIPTVSSTTSPSPAVIESSLSEGSGATEGETEDDGDSGEDNEGDDAGKNRKKSRLTFSTRKRTFTPQIRPFASRNRPTFNPKRKTALGSSATTITRATVTPTVTATPAAKTEINGAGKGRFSSNRRGNSSGLYKTIHNDIRPTPSGASARRTSRIRGSPVSSAASSFSTHYTGRGRSSAGSSRLYATSTPGQNGPSRRGGFYRSSSSRVAGSSDYPFRGSTSVSHHGASSSRFRIRPTQSSLLGRTGSTAFTTPSTEETIEPDDDLTTIVTDETPHFTDDEHDSPTQPISTTTESSRRSNNPLLRFRRPPTLRAPQTTSSTPKPTTTQSSRRSPLLRRPASERGATTAKPRTTNKYNPVTNRQRPGNNLFPPRGLLKKPEKEDEEETKEGEFDGEEQENEEIKEEQDNEEDIDDNEYEESETKESKTQPNKSANRRSDKPYNPVNIRPFVGFNRKPRTKRQVEYGTKSGMGSARGFTPRYRRPGVSTRSPQESVEDPEPVQDTVKPKPSNPGRFTPRPRTSTPTQPRVRPTSVSSNTGRSQFTLRKEDTSTNNRASFRRPTTASPRRRTNIKPPEPTTSAQRPKPPRLRTQSNTRQSEATTHSWSNTRRNPNTSRRGSTRTRYRGETSDFDTYTYSQSSFDGSITVTHHIPTEVTIPVVNGRVTEYRNVITASASTEVLGPHQYTVSTAKDGNTVLYLTSEVTGTLPSGVTEITQFLIHETPTTSVIFTPTTIRGHKTSYSHIIPSTVYDVEQVVNTLQPQVSPNAPLANILLSQLLLGNLGLQPNLNPLLALNNPGPPSTPTTEFKTRQTTYVTTVTKGTSTVIPLTFRGKEILTTIVDSSTEVITATEFITDTIVVTPTAALGAGSNQLNSLLLPALLQAQLLGGQPQQQSMVQNPLLSGLQQQLLQQEPKLIHDTSLENTAPEQPLRRRQRPPEEQDRLVRDSEKEILDDDVVQVVKDEDTGRDRSFKTSRTKSRTDKKPPDPPPIPAETSVVTLYVSGRRPGEFSTVISTVTLGDESSAAIRKREAGFAAPEMFTVEASQVPEIGGSFPTSDDGYLDNYVMSAMNEVSGQASETETQSLESIVGDVSSYVSSVIGQSSSSSKLLALRSSSTENPTPFSTENKKKLPGKKTNPSSFNSSYSTGHFLSNGPAEFAPLKRKVINKENRGMLTMLNDNKQNISKANVQSKPKYENSTCAMVFEKREFLRKKRSTEDNLGDKDNGSIHSEIPSHRRRKVRIKVPINRKKLSEDKSVNKEEILTLSEAQHSARVPNMDIGAQHIEKHEHGKTSPQPEYGSRMESIIHGQEPVTSNSHEEGNNHQRRKIFVTRRKKTEHSTVSSDLDDYSISSSVPANTPDRAQDFLVITTYRPKEIPFFVSSNVAVDEKDLYLFPTTVRGNKVVMSTTSGRRRIVVTRKRPIIMTPTQRRRVVVTKKRPVPNFDLDIEPTNVIPESMSTIYSYKYTVLNRDKELSTDTENMVKVSQVFMSGGVNHEVYDDREIIEESKKKYYEETPTSLETDIRVEKSKTEQNSNVLISKQASNGQQSLIPTSNFPVTEMSTQRLITIQPSQIESSFKISTHDLENETLTFGVSTQDLPLEISSLKISSLTLANNDIIKSQGATSVLQPENDYKSVNTDIKHEKEENKKNIQGEENEYSGENKEDDQTHNRATTASYEFTTESPSITEDSLISITEESSFDGPRFVRPTRFSITKRPGRIKTTFPGRRQTSVLTPTSTTGSNSIHSSSGNYKSYYRGRQPLTSSRTFGRSSKTHTHLYTTATTNVPTEPVPHFDDSPSYNLSNSPSSALFDDSSLSIHTSSESPSESSPTPSSITPVPATTASSHTVVPDISSTVVMETVMSTRLRTYTYIVTRVAGQEQVVTSTTEVKPHVTTFIVTKTLPVLATEMNGPVEARGLNVNGAGEARYNLATKVMSNGVEVIVAGDRSTLPGEPQVLRVLSSSLSRPITLAPSTLTDHMVLFLPHESSQVEAQLSSSLQQNVFATNTYLTTYTYLTTFLQDGVTTVSSNEKIVSNVVTEERTGTNTITPTPITALTLSASPFLSTGVFHTTYTYLNTLIDGDVPLVVTSQHTVTNTLTAPHDYLLQLQPSGQSTFDTNTYLSTVAFTKTLTDGTDVKIVSTEDILTQVVITESNKKATEVKGIVSDNRPAASHSSLQQGSITNVVKTYFVTYTYFSTFLEGGNTVIRTNIATSSDVVTEKFYVPPKRTMPPSLIPTKSKNEIKVTPTSKIDEKIDFQKQSLHLYATKTYLTTFTYFTTLLQDGGGDHISTIVSSRTRIVQNVVTESVDSSLLDPEYLDSLRSSIHADSVSSSSIVATATLSGGQELKITAMNHNLKPTSTVDAEVTPTSVHHELSSSMEEASDNVNNIIKGSTIIFFDEEDQIDSSSTSQTLAIEMGGHTKATPSLSSVLSISMIQSTALNTEGTTALFSQDTPGAQPLVSSPTPALQESATTVLPSSLPITFSPVSYLTSILATSIVTPSGTTLQPGEQVIMMTQHGGNVTMIPVSDPANKKPTGGIGPGGSEIEVSDLLSLGSLGINGLNALGPVINAMAGLIQSNLNNDKRRNDTSVIIVPSTTSKPRPAYYGDNSGNPLPIYVPPKPVYPQDHESTTPVRSPIYIPVGAVAGDDTEDVATAESQRYEGIANLNGDMKWPQQGFPDTNQRRPVDSAAIGRPIESALLGDGIPISPGQVITANSDVIVGKPAIMGPRPPKINGNKDEIPLGMKPPPPPPPASTVWSNRDTPSGHTPIREHGSGHIPLRETFPPPPNRNHAPLRDHVPLREHGYHSSSHHHPSEDDIPLLPPPVAKPDISGHLPNVHENYSEEQIMNVPAKASAISDLQTVFQGKPVNQGIDIIHGNPIQVFGQTEPISLDRSSGIPLLVNIQPSQVANVIIPHGGSTAAHTFSDQGNGFYDPAPHPLPESNPGFVEIGGPENESHNIHPEYHASHDSQVSGTRMDLPPQEPENIGHINDHTSQQGINVEISPGQGVNVDVSPGHGINVDVSPGQGINVDVSPGQGLNVEIAPGHYSLNGEHVSPSGIVLDVPLQGRPGTPNRRPTPNVHSHHHRPTWPPTQQLPPPPPPAKHHPTSSTSPVHGHSFPHHPMPPTDFMIPPPPPHTHFKPDSFHNSGNFHGPAIPLNPTGLHPPGPKTQDHIIQSDGNDAPTEVEGGEVMQESNQRPLRPGQIPVEVLLANSASTHRPIIVRPGTILGAKHDEVLHQMKPPQSMFDQPPQPDRPLKPNPENRPYKPNYKETPYIQITEQRPHHTKPQPNFDNRPHSTNVNGSLQQFRPNEGPQFPNSEEIPEHSRPEVVIEGRPHTSNNWNHVKQKPVISYTDGTSYSVQPQSHQSELSDSKLNTNSEQHPQNSKHDENSHFNKTLEINFGGANMNHRPQQPIFDKHDDLNKLDKPSTSEPLYDLETQANTPRPFSILPSVPKQPDFDFNTDELVVGLAPPPRVTPGGSNGQRFPMLSIEPQVSSHRPVVNIGNHRRPPIRTKPPPYKFELPPTTEQPTTIQKTSDKRPFWIRPPLQEISIPISTYTENVTKPNEDENKNLIKKPSLPQDSNYTHRRPITTWRPPLSSDRPRPPRPSTSESTESIYSHTSAATDDVSIGPNSYTIIGGADKPLLPDSTPVLQTVVIGKPIPKEPVISPTAVKDSEKRKTTYSTEGLWNEDIIIGSESPGNIPHSQGHATPSENIQKKKTSMLSATTTLISIGSKTIFGNLFTKPSTMVVKPSKIAEPTQSTSLVSDHHKENESFYHSNTDSDDDDAMGFENKDHKPDLGIASSNDDKIIFSSAAEIPTHYVTHTHTHTVTLTETTVMSSHGQQPSTRTVVVTKTQIFTHVDTVTETEFHTLVHPTSVVATVTTTVSATSSVYAPASPFDPANYPTFPVKPLSTSTVQDPGDKGQEEQVKPSSTSEGNKIHMEKNSNDVRNENITGNTGVLTGGADENESFFVVVNDQKPATININKGSKSGEDYNEVANHDESDPNSEVNHAVLLGGVLIAAPPHHNTPSTHFNNRNQGSNSCRPDCSAARNELCQKVEGRMSCVCRPGFARMFPDRPCRPTYTYKMKVGLARHGKETLHYGSSLEDNTSSHYQQLTEAAREGLDRMVMQSDLRDIYHGVVVNGFQPADKGDGVTVNFYVQLSDNIEETRLQDVFKKSLRTSNYSLGSTEMFANRDLIHHIKAEDFDECESRQFHDCSEHAQCFNLRGTYTCSCQDGYTDLSENSLFPGRVCSAELIGCEKCHYHGTCYSRGDEQLMCECFQWYAGENCHINLKVLLIALVTIGAILLGLLIVCVVLTCLKRSSQQACSTGTGFLRYRSPTHTLDKRAMIQDSSSEGSAADHGPVSYLTPTHQPASTFGSQMKPALVHAGIRKVSGAAEFSDEGMTYSDQRDRSLTVMIPRAKYRPIPPTSPLLAMSTFGAEQKRAIAQEQQKLLNYLETGKQENRNAANKKRKQSNSTNQTNETAPPPSRKSSAPRKPSTGALVSAGFEVSATVGHKEPGSDTDMASAAIVHGNGGKSGDNNHNTLASNGSHFTTLRTNDSETNMPELVAESTTDSHLDTNSRVQELTVSEARSFDETTVQPPTKSLHSNYGSNPSSRNPNDEAHTMAERDLGSTLLMPQTHLYKPDRGSDISNFDSL